MSKANDVRIHALKYITCIVNLNAIIYITNGEKKEIMNILENLKKAIESCMPDFRHYYRITKKARVMNTYASDGKYYCDVQPLRNDCSVDAKEPLVPKAEIPIMWGGKNRGVVCPPCVGVLCDLSYYDGDPNYPFISNIRWDSNNQAPLAKLNEFVIQLENGVEIRIDDAKNIIALTPANWRVTIGGNAEITADGDIIAKAKGNAEVTAGGNITAEAKGSVEASAGTTATVKATSSITIEAPQINQNGNVSSMGAGGVKGTITENADREQKGNIVLQGNLQVSGSVSAGSASFNGNCHAGSRSGGVCPHTC